MTAVQHESRPADHEWLLGEETCTITPAAFDGLLEYSATIPTGVYIGKVWRRRDADGWWLGEYTEHEDPKKAGIRWRRLVVVEVLSSLPPTKRMRRLLWTAAQHKYGWTYVRDNWASALGLERRGLVEILERDRAPRERTVHVTEIGKAYIAEHWPVSPLNLGTYDHQPDGWTPVEGVR